MHVFILPQAQPVGRGSKVPAARLGGLCQARCRKPRPASKPTLEAGGQNRFTGGKPDHFGPLPDPACSGHQIAERPEAGLDRSHVLLPRKDQTGTSGTIAPCPGGIPDGRS